MPRKYPFYPAWNGRKSSPVLVQFVKNMNRRWGFKNLGIYVNRSMRSSENLSVHATGWACDIGYTDRKTAVIAWEWLLAHTKELRIAEIHDYAYKDPKQGKAWGRGYRCSRGEGAKGVKIFTALDNAGTPGGRWLHVEIENTWKSAQEFQAAWKAIPKP
jgi:hypothetical protein